MKREAKLQCESETSRSNSIWRPNTSISNSAGLQPPQIRKAIYFLHHMTAHVCDCERSKAERSHYGITCEGVGMDGPLTLILA
jgi:hypothetical protein